MTVKPPLVQGLAETQRDFDRYQNQAFGSREPQFFALELAGECGELANLEKKMWRDPSRTECLDAVGYEAADIFIALMNYANSRGLNLEALVSEKLAKIERRRQAGEMGPSLK